VVRNEALRLPATLSHYRAIGVDRFLIVDNDSDDGSRELLEREPDVHLFATSDSFAASGCGVDWIHAVLGAFAEGHWVVTADADELFIYPHYETVDLPRFCRFLDGQGARGVFCLMLDMYSDRPLAQTTLAPGGSLIEACPFFDRGPYRLYEHSVFPYRMAFGGPRERLFRERFGGSRRPPQVSKIPLVRWDAATRYLANAHHMTPIPLAQTTGVLLHFKFLSDFAERVELEAARGQHFAGAREYRDYRDILRGGLTSLMADVSVRFQDSAQLVAMTLMQTSPAYETYARA
jgi:glycosyltransferase involved in cell wall biosynthesis